MYTGLSDVPMHALKFFSNFLHCVDEFSNICTVNSKLEYTLTFFIIVNTLTHYSILSHMSMSALLFSIFPMPKMNRPVFYRRHYFCGKALCLFTSAFMYNVRHTHRCTSLGASWSFIRVVMLSISQHWMGSSAQKLLSFHSALIVCLLWLST